MSSRSRRRLDALLVVAVLALCAGDAIDAADGDAALLVAGIGFAAVAAGLLVFRRVRPAAVAAAELAVVGAWVVALYGWEQGPFGGFVVLIVAAFALGVHGRDRRALAAVAALLAVWLARDAYGLGEGLVPVGDVLPFWLWIAGAYGIGTALRRRESLAALLEDRAVRAERERELRAREAIVEERGRIARELHDVVAHNVSVMVIQAQGAGRVLEGDQPQVRTALEAIETTGREAVDEVRRLLGVLRAGDAAPAAALAPRPGLAQLDALLDSVRAAGVRVDLDVEGRPVTLPPGIDVSAYRIVQEALTNTLRHADARHAAVVVRYAPQAVELEVRDDGRAGAGRAAGNGGGGHGLVGMRERTALFGGELSAGRQNGGGWTVRARLPVDGAATRP
jgi:signal transduction histidine kinase